MSVDTEPEGRAIMPRSTTIRHAPRKPVEPQPQTRGLVVLLLAAAVGIVLLDISLLLSTWRTP